MDEFAGSALACKALGVTVDQDIVVRLKTFMASDGTFRSVAGSKESSLQNTKLSLKVLAAFADVISPATLDEMSDAIFPLLPQGDDETAVDPTLLALLGKISSKKPRLIGARLTAVAASLLQLRHSGNLETVAHVIESLNFVTTYKASPLYFALRSSTIDFEGSSRLLVVNAVDIFGAPATVVSTEVISVKRSGRDVVLYKGILDSNSIDLSGVDGIAPGLFSVDLLLTVTGQPKPVPSTLSFIVQGSVDINNVAMGANPSKQVSLSDLATVTTQNGAEEMSASAVNGDYLHIAFDVASRTKAKSSERMQKPHQVFVKCTHKESGTSSFFVAAADGKLSDGTGNKYRATVSLTKEVETFMHQSGIYKISLLVSDVIYGTPIEWSIGSVELLFPAKIIKDSPLYAKPLMYTSDNTLKALPEITHVMKADSKRASAFMSTIFTALTAAPLALFIAYIMFLGPNLRRLQSLSGYLFVGCLLTTLFLYAGYWLALEGVSFYDTIKYLCFLAPITIIVGSTAVSSVADVRINDIHKSS